jgi:hypothetical protein
MKGVVLWQAGPRAAPPLQWTYFTALRKAAQGHCGAAEEQHSRTMFYLSRGKIFLYVFLDKRDSLAYYAPVLKKLFNLKFHSH